MRPLLLHRAKSQCLDLPPKRRRFQPVTLTPAAAADFEQRLDGCVRDFRRRAASGLVRRDAEALAVLTALRRIGSQHKLPAAVQLLQSLLASEEPVVVFSAFVATAQALHQHFGADAEAVLLTGAVPVRQRQGLVDAFQQGRRRLLIATFGTGGLGFTLHRARHVVLIERPWTPGDAEQAEDRCHRIGMAGMLTSHWLQLGQADAFVDSLIADKAERINLLLQSRERLRQQRTLPALVRQLLEQW